MGYKLGIGITFLFVSMMFSFGAWAETFSSAQESVYAQSRNKFISLETELSLEYRSDRLRTMQNTEAASIRNLSLLVSLFENEKSKFVFEILGEEDLLGELNVNIGELFYHSKVTWFKDKDLEFNIGVLKLNYGIMNRLDGLFSVMPSYYSFLYDLPRGLDTGVQVSSELFDPSLVLSAGAFIGKNLRQTDTKNRNIEVVPHHLKLSWSGLKKSRLALNYFSRKYEAQALIRGVGVEYQGLSLLQFGGVRVDIDMEAWSIAAGLNGLKNEALTALVAPKISYKNMYLQAYLAWENWRQDGTASSTENFLTGKLGYVFNKNLQLILEQTQVKNTTYDIYKENSLQARVVSQWQF